MTYRVNALLSIIREAWIYTHCWRGRHSFNGIYSLVLSNFLFISKSKRLKHLEKIMTASHIVDRLHREIYWYPKTNILWFIFLSPKLIVPISVNGDFLLSRSLGKTMRNNHKNFSSFYIPYQVCEPSYLSIKTHWETYWNVKTQKWFWNIQKSINTLAEDH